MAKQQLIGMVDGIAIVGSGIGADDGDEDSDSICRSLDVQSNSLV
jgi:hypothetical protein